MVNALTHTELNQCGTQIVCGGGGRGGGERTSAEVLRHIQELREDYMETAVSKIAKGQKKKG